MQSSGQVSTSPLAVPATASTSLPLSDCGCVEAPSSGRTGVGRSNVDARSVSVHRQQFAERGRKFVLFTKRPQSRLPESPGCGVLDDFQLPEPIQTSSASRTANLACMKA